MVLVEYRTASSRLVGAVAFLVIASSSAVADETIPNRANAAYQEPSQTTGEEISNAAAVRDPYGNLYGVTASGGAYDRGTVYRVAPDGTKTILHSFAGGRADGASPIGNLLLGKAGQVYGTTRDGGTANCGTVFEIDIRGEERILHAFSPSEGLHTMGVLHADEFGNLYGATTGAHEALYRLAPDGTLTILLQFA